MPTDFLTLGPFVFTDFSVPERMPFGGKQQMHIHRMPGGSRVIDAMGSDDIDRAWHGTLWGSDAIGDALTLDAMRRSGEELPYANGIESRTVVVLEFLPQVRKVTCVEYSIVLVCTDNPMGGGFGFGGIDAQIGLDIASAVGLL
jgi:hypothetical protein